MRKKTIGRPKIAKADFRGKLISLRFRPDELKEIQAAVKKSGESQSEWIRATLLEKARRT